MSVTDGRQARFYHKTTKFVPFLSEQTETEIIILRSKIKLTERRASSIIFFSVQIISPLVLNEAQQQRRSHSAGGKEFKPQQHAREAPRALQCAAITRRLAVQDQRVGAFGGSTQGS